jgi:hypothetical protein
VARTHGRIYTSIWDSGSEFRTLTARAQRVYLVLLSQPQINNCGCLPYVPKKWVRLAPDETDATLETAIRELVDRRFIVLDEQTDELLIRTFIKHDRIEKQPQLAQAARREFGETESREIRRQLLLGYPDLFGDVAPDSLRDPLPEPLFDPSSEGSREGSAKESNEGSGEGSLARATRTRTRAPAPSPTPAPSPKEIEEMAVRPSREPQPRTNGLPFEKERLTVELLSAIGDDADERTPDVVRSLAKRLPESALVKVNESLRTQRPQNRASYAVGALQSEFAEIASRT